MSIFVILLNWNGKQDTIECLESLKNVTTPHHLVVVDNGSIDGSKEAVMSKFPKITWIENKKNLGYAEGNNVGIHYALKEKASFILILNNDTIVAPDFLEAFLETFEKNPKIAILGGKVHLYDHPEKLDHLGGMWNSRKGQFDLIGFRDKKEKWYTLQTLDYVCGCAIFAKAEVFQKIGGFDPRFFLFWEESDWCFRAKQAGYFSYFCPGANLWHKVSASFHQQKTTTTYFWWRNRLLWIRLNCKNKERLRLFFKIFFCEVCRICKLYVFKKMQLFVGQIFYPKKDFWKKKRCLHNYRVSLRGVKDYFLSCFGSGPLL